MGAAAGSGLGTGTAAALLHDTGDTGHGDSLPIAMGTTLNLGRFFSPVSEHTENCETCK